MTTVRIAQPKPEPIGCYIESYKDYAFFIEDLKKLKLARMKAEDDFKALDESGVLTAQRRQEKLDILAAHIRREDGVQKELLRFQSKWNRRIAIGAVAVGSVIAAGVVFWIKRR